MMPQMCLSGCYRPYQGLPKYKPEKFNCRVLSKLIFRLLGRFNVDSGMGYYNILWSYLSNKEQSQFVFFHAHQGIFAFIYPGEFQGLINDIEKTKLASYGNYHFVLSKNEVLATNRLLLP